MPITGRCLCGNIRYEIDGEVGRAGVCHCKNCQRQSGTAFSALVPIKRDDFRLTSGELKCYHDSDTATGNTVHRYFCGNCGSPIYSGLDQAPDLVILKNGTLDDTSWFQPTMHGWCESKQNWIEIDDSVRQKQRQ